MMNANELADMLEVDSWYKLVTREEIATMLRQQQAEIEALKGGFFDWSGFKELTDEEITELANEYLCYISHEYEVTGIYKFARAILRKAQEK